jgi:hypothetical protein
MLDACTDIAMCSVVALVFFCFAVAPAGEHKEEEDVWACNYLICLLASYSLTTWC